WVGRTRHHVPSINHVQSMLDDLLQHRPYNAAADFIDTNLARGRGSKVAFSDGQEALTYAELQARTFQFAAALRTLGLRPEERLALLLYDTVGLPIAFWGGVRAGVVVLPLNTLLAAEQYAYILGDSRASAIVVAAALARNIAPILDRLPRLRTVVLVGASDEQKAAFAGREVYD